MQAIDVIVIREKGKCMQERLPHLTLRYISILLPLTIISCCTCTHTHRHRGCSIHASPEENPKERSHFHARTTTTTKPPQTTPPPSNHAGTLGGRPAHSHQGCEWAVGHGAAGGSGRAMVSRLKTGSYCRCGPGSVTIRDLDVTSPKRR